MKFESHKTLEIFLVFATGFTWVFSPSCKVKSSPDTPSTKTMLVPSDETARREGDCSRRMARSSLAEFKSTQ